MSVTVEYSFNSKHSFERLTDILAKDLGIALAPVEGDSGILFGRYLGMEFDFCSEHGLENDRDCNFEDYQFQLCARTPWATADLRPIQTAAMLTLAYVLYRKATVEDGLLTYDVQIALARYRPSLAGWRDELSGELVVFPQHFADICSKKTV